MARIAQRLTISGLALLLLAGCNTTRYLGKNEVYLERPPSFSGNKNLSTAQLGTVVRTKQNSKLLGVKFYLGLHNAGQALAHDSSAARRLYGKLDSQQRYLRKIVRLLRDTLGEKPVIFDPKLAQSDARNVQSYYFSQGYLDATVAAELQRYGHRGKRGRLTFRIQEGKPFILTDIKYRTRASDLAQVLRDSSASVSFLKIGDKYNEEKLSQERQRLATLLRNLGYYRFAPDAITYTVDTLAEAEADTINLQALFNLTKDSLARLRIPDAANASFRPIRITVEMPDTARRYTIQSVDVTLRRASQLIIDSTERFNLAKLPPALARAFGVRRRWVGSGLDVTFQTYPELARAYNLGLIARRVRQRPGDLYSLQEVQRTQSQFNALGIFRNAVPSFTVDDSAGTLAAHYDLSLLRNWTFGAGAEGFVSNDRQLNTNLPGFGISLQVRNRNLFGGAENLDVQTAGNISFYTPGNNQPVQSFFQYTLRANLTIPGFTLLESPRRDLTRLRPSTTFSLSASQEQRQQFRRTTLVGSWQYQWYGSIFSQRSYYTFSPLSVTFVESRTFPAFETLLAELSPSIRQFIRRDFTPRLTTKSTFYWAYSYDYGISRTRVSWFFRPGLEAGGNIPYLLDISSNQGKPSRDSTGQPILNNKYSYGQFGRLSVEGKVFVPLNQKTELVGRIFLGASRGLNQTNTVPYQNRFFTGGTNSIRGWQSNSLGPGTWRDSIPINNLIAPGGEYALEANLEYRFPVAGPSVRGAFFVDAGNVWFSSTSNFLDSRAYLKKGNLELGVAAGLGIRYDLSFFVVRLDIGQQVYAPDLKALVVKQFPRDVGGARIQYNLGIGYPF